MRSNPPQSAVYIESYVSEDAFYCDRGVNNHEVNPYKANCAYYYALEQATNYIYDCFCAVELSLHLNLKYDVFNHSLMKFGMHYYK